MKETWSDTQTWLEIEIYVVEKGDKDKSIVSIDTTGRKPIPSVLRRL